MSDISLETLCPKCGFDPTEQRVESYRHVTTYDRDDDLLHLQCPRCGWSWKVPCADVAKPKVLK